MVVFSTELGGIGSGVAGIAFSLAPGLPLFRSLGRSLPARARRMLS